MSRVALAGLIVLGLILALSPDPALADAGVSPPVAPMDPGLDPAFEAERRSQPVGWTGAGVAGTLAVGFFLLAFALSRREAARGAALFLTCAGLCGGWLTAELILLSTVDRWTAHVKIRSGCYHSNPRGTLKRSTFYDDPSVVAYCSGELSEVWRACDTPSPSSPEPEVRLLAVGDSFTDGVGVFAHETWPAQLEGSLGELLRGSDQLRVTNCGRADSYTVHVAQRYLEKSPLHRPTGVIYAMVLNDVESPTLHPDRPDISFQLETRDQYTDHVGKEIRWSAVYLFAREVWARRIMARDTERRYQEAYADPQGQHLIRALDLMSDMNRVAEDRGQRFLVTLWPMLHSLGDYPFEQAHQRVAEGLEKRGVPFLDLLPVFRDRDEDALHVHPTDYHPNEVAHGLAADAIQAELLRREWLPRTPGNGPP